METRSRAAVGGSEFGGGDWSAIIFPLDHHLPDSFQPQYHLHHYINASYPLESSHIHPLHLSNDRMPTFSKSHDSTAFATHTYNTIDEMALNALAQELGDNIPETDPTWSASLYHDLTEIATIEGYFEKSGEHLNGKWVRMPASPTTKSELSKSLRDLINSILKYFRISRPDAMRQAVDIHEAPFKPADAGSSGLFASPNVVVEASGPSFSPPKGASIGFSNVSACFIAKLDADADNILDDLVQTTGFAK